MAKKYILQTHFGSDYLLIAIKSVLEDYRMAYYLNKHFNLQLKKEDFSLNFPKIDGDFPVFGFENPETNSYWALISNKQVIEKTVSQTTFNLFEAISNTYILIPEEKTTDYFLKVESDCKKEGVIEIIKKINIIHRVITAYEINPNDLKSKDLLIF